MVVVDNPVSQPTKVDRDKRSTTENSLQDHLIRRINVVALESILYYSVQAKKDRILATGLYDMVTSIIIENVLLPRCGPCIDNAEKAESYKSRVILLYGFATALFFFKT